MAQSASVWLWQAAGSSYWRRLAAAGARSAAAQASPNSSAAAAAAMAWRRRSIYGSIRGCQNARRRVISLIERKNHIGSGLAAAAQSREA